MSWPTDGGPRFTVNELHWVGYGWRRHGHPHVDFTIADRADNHRTVASLSTFSESRRGRSFDEQVEALRNRAAGIVALLEDEVAR